MVLLLLFDIDMMNNYLHIKCNNNSMSYLDQTPSSQVGNSEILKVIMWTEARLHKISHSTMYCMLQQVIDVYRAVIPDSRQSAENVQNDHLFDMINGY